MGDRREKREEYQLPSIRLLTAGGHVSRQGAEQQEGGSQAQPPPGPGSRQHRYPEQQSGGHQRQQPLHDEQLRHHAHPHAAGTAQSNHHSRPHEYYYSQPPHPPAPSSFQHAYPPHHHSGRYGYPPREPQYAEPPVHPPPDPRHGEYRAAHDVRYERQGPGGPEYRQQRAHPIDHLMTSSRGAPAEPAGMARSHYPPYRPQSPVFHQHHAMHQRYPRPAPAHVTLPYRPRPEPGHYPQRDLPDSSYWERRGPPPRNTAAVPAATVHPLSPTEQPRVPPGVDPTDGQAGDRGAAPSHSAEGSTSVAPAGASPDHGVDGAADEQDLEKDVDEALLKRRKRNAESAARLRERRKNREQDLTASCDKLEQQIAHLESELTGEKRRALTGLSSSAGASHAALLSRSEAEPSTLPAGRSAAAPDRSETGARHKRQRPQDPDSEGDMAMGGGTASASGGASVVAAVTQSEQPKRLRPLRELDQVRLEDLKTKIDTLGKLNQTVCLNLGKLRQEIKRISETIATRS
ncbi:hypothetical protein GGF46_001855 [Coemansia sp. RSA 552]|nr:hypothetical protein GGF46_001855 [Coemansia sp. RSA 552]